MWLSWVILITYKKARLISPTDFNCMGYCIPATIAPKMAHPNITVIGIVGDGAAQMTGLELITASSYDIATILCIFNDSELGQIAQFQKVPLKDKVCTVLGNLKFEGLAMATACEYIKIENDHHIEELMDKALKLSIEGNPVLVDIMIDYSKKTMLTKGVIKTNLSRFPLKEKVRFFGRMLKRHILG